MPKQRIDPYAARIRYENGQEVQSIAKDWGVSRVGIWKAWKKIGYSTNGFRVKRLCASCGKTVERRRASALRSMKSFCNMNCYVAWIHEQGENYKPWRQGQRRAKMAVSKLFNLQPGNVIHHVDKNSRHNEPENLWVFASQADHMRFHRGGDAKPIWKGDSLSARPE